MTDAASESATSPTLHISTTRRVVFTALALVTFWVLAWNAYWMGFEDGMPAVGIGGHQWNTAVTQAQMEVLQLKRFLRENTSICFAILPAILLSLAIYWPWSLLRRRHMDQRDQRMLTATLLFLVTIEVCYRLGESDAGATQEVSWLWFLTSIVLTTAFVGYGVVRLAKAEVVENEYGAGE